MIDQYFQNKVNPIFFGLGIVIVWGLIWCIIKLYNIVVHIF